MILHEINWPYYTCYIVLSGLLMWRSYQYQEVKRKLEMAEVEAKYAKYELKQYKEQMQSMRDALAEVRKGLANSEQT